MNYLLATAVRRRWLILTCVASLHGVVGSLQPRDLQDARLFAAAGRDLLSMRWQEVYADPLVQAGPVQLLFSGIVGTISQVARIDLRFPLSVIVEVAVALSVAMVAGRMARRRGNDPHLAELASGLAATLLAFGWMAYGSGQQAEVFIPLLWIIAMHESERGRHMRAAVLLGVAGGIKLWGILGVPIVLSGRDLRRSVVSAATASGIIIATYLPFLVLGSRMFGFEWLAFPDAPVAAMVGSRDGFTWGWRLAQGLVVASLASTFVVLGRGRMAADWATVVVVTTLRIFLDPVFWYWYWLPVAIAALLGLCFVRTDWRGSVPWVVGPILVAMILTDGGQWQGLIVAALGFLAIAGARPREALA